MANFEKAKYLDQVGYAIRGKIHQTASALKQKGHQIIELNIGNPGLYGLLPPDSLNMAMVRNLDKAAAYSDTKGIFSAREAIVIDTQNKGLQGIHVDHVYLGNGVSELANIAISALLNEGDEVLVPSPDYPLWSAIVASAKAKPVYYDCLPENDWQPDPEQMASLITDRTKGIVVINPNNPTGSVYQKEVLQGIVELAKVKNLVLFSDEIYDKVLYDQEVHFPMAGFSDDVLVLTFSGLSKNYRACGFRSGWMYLSGPVHKAKNYIEGIDMLASMRLCANVTAQYAVQIALGGYQSITDLCNSNGRLGKQRAYSYERLNAMEGVSCTKPKGAMYVFPQIELDKFDFSSDEDMVHKLLIEQKVLTVQGSGFNYYNSAAFRIAFLPQLDILSKAYDRIEEFLKTHRY